MADATPASPSDRTPQSPSALPATPSLLDRSDLERLREFKYRFGQSIVFGLPVAALELVGRSLGGHEADRWVSLLQGLLAGWVVYVAATGMAVEGVLLLVARRRLSAWLLTDAAVSCASLLLYLISLLRLVPLLTGNSIADRLPSFFTAAVVLLAAWSCLRWWTIKRSAGGPGRALRD